MRRLLNGGRKKLDFLVIEMQRIKLKIYWMTGRIFVWKEADELELVHAVGFSG